MRAPVVYSNCDMDGKQELSETQGLQLPTLLSNSTQLIIMILEK